MKYGSDDVCRRLRHPHRRAGTRGGGARLRVAVSARAHAHPASRRSPGPAGAELPKEYWHTLDLFVALTAAAAVTTTLKLVTGICLLVERDPITTAKEVASLDLLSNGRVIFGIGGGWNAEEMENHGTTSRRAGSCCANASRR